MRKKKKAGIEPVGFSTNASDLGPTVSSSSSM
jgi:hypothetical protein